jgi:hypothetical protein
MTPQLLAARIHFMATQLHGEAQRWGPSSFMRARLDFRRQRLLEKFYGAYSPDPEVRGDAVLSLGVAIDVMVEAASTRAERELAKGATP